MDFLYSIGITTERCVNEGEFNEYNIKKNSSIIKESFDITFFKQIGKI